MGDRKLRGSPGRLHACLPAEDSLCVSMGVFHHMLRKQRPPALSQILKTCVITQDLQSSWSSPGDPPSSHHPERAVEHANTSSSTALLCSLGSPERGGAHWLHRSLRCQAASTAFSCVERADDSQIGHEGWGVADGCVPCVELWRHRRLPPILTDRETEQQQSTSLGTLSRE